MSISTIVVDVVVEVVTDMTSALHNHRNWLICLFTV